MRFLQSMMYYKKMAKIFKKIFSSTEKLMLVDKNLSYLSVSRLNTILNGSKHFTTFEKMTNYYLLKGK